VRLDGEKVDGIETMVTVEQDRVLQVGKRRFLKLIAASQQE
jgi:hypothetical protein